MEAYHGNSSNADISGGHLCSTSGSGDLSSSSSSGAVDWNALSYAIMFQMTTTQLGVGRGAVVDCPLAHLRLYRQAEEIAAQVRQRACWGLGCCM